MQVQSRADNKKIGELVCDGAMKFVDNFAVEINGERVAEYKSLDAVAKDWKDYKPVEPQIRDEKVKKLLGEVVELELTVNELSKRFDEFNKHYVELCGEEG